MFLYNNKLYQQIDGVAMGCPLAQWRTHGGGGGLGVKPPPPFGDGTGNEDLSFYFNDPLLLRTELAEIANMSLLFNSPVNPR